MNENGDMFLVYPSLFEWMISVDLVFAKMAFATSLLTA